MAPSSAWAASDEPRPLRQRQFSLRDRLRGDFGTLSLNPTGDLAMMGGRGALVLLNMGATSASGTFPP